MMHADRGMTKMRRVRSKGTGSRERETEEWYLSVCAYILTICWGQPSRPSRHQDRTAAHAQWHRIPDGIYGRAAQCVDERRAARSDTPVRDFCTPHTLCGYTNHWSRCVKNLSLHISPCLPRLPCHLPHESSCSSMPSPSSIFSARNDPSLTRAL